MNAFGVVAAVLTGLVLVSLPGTICAQDVQPKVYTPAPVGVNLVTLGYAFSTGAVLFDKTIPIENATGNIHSIAAVYSRSIGVFGKSGRADLALPLVTGDWEGEVQRVEQSTSRTGFGDPALRFAVFLSGAPALSKQEFRGFRPKTIVGATIRLTIPLGQYDANKIVNLGSNRWILSPQLGVSHIAGRLLLEAYAGVWFFTDNNEFLGTSTLSQNPLYTFQVHVGYWIRRGFWIAASSRQSLGGATAVDGGDKLEAEANNRIGLTLAYPLGGRYALRGTVTTGLTATVGNDYTTAAVLWQIVF